MKAFLRLMTGLAAVALAGCERSGEEGSPPDAEDSRSPGAGEVAHVRETGGAAARLLMESLGGQLKGALQAGGPVNAIEVCRQTAIPLTDAVGVNLEGVRVRRTTLKPRNPANAPDEIDRRVLEGMAATASPEPVIEWQESVARFYQPLIVQELCLNCHGDPATFSPELVEALAERYPEDRATGYAPGDFRGVIRVDIDRP